MAQNDIRAQVSQARPSALATSSVLRNTYLLLGLTLIFSAITAGGAMVMNAPYPGLLPTLIGYFGLLYITSRLRNSAWGLLSVFALTGFMGYTLGPILNMVLAGSANGGQIIMTAFAGTGFIFFALSAYILTTRKDLSHMSSFLFIGFMVAIAVFVMALVFQTPFLVLTMSAIFMVVCSFMIMYQTSAIINGGERNYIMATVSLYIALFNIFVSLLNILMIFTGRD